MDVVIADLPGVTRATLSGRLDTATVDAVEMRFVAGVVPKDLPTIVDLSQVSFIASLGIRMLLSTARALARNGAKLVLFGATPAVMEILETTAVDAIIPIAGTEAEAMALAAG